MLQQTKHQSHIQRSNLPQSQFFCIFVAGVNTLLLLCDNHRDSSILVIFVPETRSNDDTTSTGHHDRRFFRHDCHAEPDMYFAFTADSDRCLFNRAIRGTKEAQYYSKPIHERKTNAALAISADIPLGLTEFRLRSKRYGANQSR